MKHSLYGAQEQMKQRIVDIVMISIFLFGFLSSAQIFYFDYCYWRTPVTELVQTQLIKRPVTHTHLEDNHLGRKFMSLIQDLSKDHEEWREAYIDRHPCGCPPDSSVGSYVAPLH